MSSFLRFPQSEIFFAPYIIFRPLADCLTFLPRARVPLALYDLGRRRFLKSFIQLSIDVLYSCGACWILD